MASRDARRGRGRRAERIAAWWLRLRGWSVLASNVRIAGVEIDLLVRKGAVDCLVEVKARRLRRGEPRPDLEGLVSRRQRRRLALAAAAHARRGRRTRVDLLLVTSGNGWPRVRRHEGLDLRSEVG